MVVDSNSTTEPATLGAGGNLRKVNAVAIALLKADSLDDLLWSLAEEVARALELEDCIVYRRVEDRLVQAAAHGPKNPGGRKIKEPITIPLGEGITGTVAKTGVSMLVGDTQDDPFYVTDAFEGRSELAVPLTWEGEVIGVIDSESSRPNAFSQSDRFLLQWLADIAAPRIASAIGEAERRQRLEELTAANRELEEKVRSAARA